MEKNRSHGKIDTLPEPLKKKVEEKLLDGETYQDICMNMTMVPDLRQS